ncbi:glycosyltransferase family A protein [Kinneretia asaccharophila]|uniref:Glycosyltransferase involved in cell wall biosynthesis n=1 Tax=Roseateles asaccharophilus TaxID=582607 RepID=A0A4R6N0L8_9BURK|nr:glycosyltransferase family A protein [Roseateles asaccharophilus]MDN3545615.1 glycosyltransferase family A protein [Roseateles asaccharophilus]TDP07483.1 glycosyltransferase involved in cell wall biosynthesis [Roseateles asaccharophilus]
MKGSTTEKPRPQWSIIVPLYNKQDFIVATLQSVLGQVGAGDFEIVVVDDGSRDQGPARVIALGDPRIRLIRQANAGVSAARNNGVRASVGTWILFLDADDLLHPQALAALGDIAARFPEAKVLAGSYVRVSDRQVSGYRFAPHPISVEFREIRDLPGEILRAGMVFYTSSIAISREYFGSFETWFPEGESLGEDLDFWLRLAETSPIQFGSYCIALYRVDLPSSLSSSRVFDRLFPYLERLEERARTGKVPTRLVWSSLKLVADARVSMARESIRRGRRWAAPGLLFLAWRRVASIRWWFTWAAVLSPGLLRWRER